MDLELNKYVLGIIAVIIAVVIGTGTLAPVISDASTATYSNDNPGWARLSEYDDFDDIPWDNLTVTFSNGRMALIQDGTVTNGTITNMILFAGKGEDCVNVGYIYDGMFCYLDIYPYNGQTVIHSGAEKVSSISFTKDSGYISFSSQGSSLSFYPVFFRDARSGSFSHTYTDFVVPDYKGGISTFKHGHLYNDMDQLYSMGFFSGLTSINEYSSYKQYSSSYVDNQLEYVFSCNPFPTTYIMKVEDDSELILNSSWTANGNAPAIGTNVSNPSSADMPDPTIPTVPTSYVSPEFTDGVWGFNVLSSINRTVALVSYSGTGGSIIIPATVFLSGQDYSVVQLGAGEGHPLFNNSAISSGSTITFEQDSHAIGISVISDSAFQGCTNLTGDLTLHWDYNGGSIGNYAFMGSGFRFIDITSFSVSLGDYCFADCPNLLCVANTDRMTSEGCCMNDTSLISYSSVSVNPTSIVADAVVVNDVSDYAFYGCSSLKILSPVGSVGKMAFKGCTAASIINVTDTTAILYGAFASCPNVELQSYHEGKFTIGASVIDSRAFEGFGSNNDLGILTLSNSLAAICDNSFAESGFSVVKIPDSCQFIGRWAFNSSNLSILNLGNGVRTIDYNAFGSSNLSDTLVLPASLVSVGNAAFSYTDISSVIDRSVADLDSGAFFGSPVSEVMSEFGRTYTCFGSHATISDSYSADMYLSAVYITTTLKGPIYSVLFAIPVIFMAGIVFFVWRFMSRQSE